MQWIFVLGVFWVGVVMGAAFTSLMHFIFTKED